MHRRDLLHHFTSDAIYRAVLKGQVRRPFRGVYMLPIDDPLMLVRAALCFVGDEAVVSHTTAVALWGLSDLVDPIQPVHLDVGAGRSHAKAPGLVVHRRRIVVGAARRSGLLVRSLETSLVDSWDWLTRHLDQPDPLRRALVIEAVGRRLTHPVRLKTVAAERADVAGRQDLGRLVHLLVRGCRSELELWGHEHVFAGLAFERNIAVDLGGRTVYLDMLDRATLTNVELDGRRWHTAPADRERDLRRDAALAARGYQVVRVSGSRLHLEPATVRREVEAIIAARSPRS